MKKILLCGDSIKFGYQRYVMGALDGVAEVYALTESGRFAQHMLRWLHEWKEKEKIPTDIDLVHWNVGLWDVLRIMDSARLLLLNFMANCYCAYKNVSALCFRKQSKCLRSVRR